jgi:hypothetical protein
MLSQVRKQPSSAPELKEKATGEIERSTDDSAEWSFLRSSAGNHPLLPDLQLVLLA